MYKNNRSIHINSWQNRTSITWIVFVGEMRLVNKIEYQNIIQYENIDHNIISNLYWGAVTYQPVCRGFLVGVIFISLGFCCVERAPHPCDITIRIYKLSAPRHLWWRPYCFIEIHLRTCKKSHINIPITHNPFININYLKNL